MTSVDTKVVHVAAGVIIDGDGKILIAKRPEHVHQGGLWEFPGGKVDEGETVEQALRRELFEELGITLTGYQPLLEIRHDYPNKSVLLDVWLVTGFSGLAHGKEEQKIAWVTKSELSQYAFPQANIAIIEAVQSTNLSS